jgi:phage tail-like protein
MAQQMGWFDDFGLSQADGCFKRKNRWLLKIDNISAQGLNALPPQKASRPSVSFKELSMEHLNETIYYPGKPEWKPITLTLYDLKKNSNPVLGWINQIYDTGTEQWNASADGFKKDAYLELYDGTGETLESWLLVAAWPQDINFGDLDMGTSEVVTVDVTLRYDRAVSLV